MATPQPPRPRPDTALLIATACGTVHTVFSAIWASGSDLMLDTIGDVADRVTALGPRRATLLLAGITLAKGGLTVGTLAEALGLLGTGRLRRYARRTEATVGISLAGYGALSIALSGAGIITQLRTATPDPATLTAHSGHLMLWDPLFLLWGIGLARHALRRTPTESTERQP